MQVVCKIIMITSDGRDIESDVFDIPDRAESLQLIGEFVEKMKGLNHVNS